jgi:hypothetical protein
MRDPESLIVAICFHSLYCLYFYIFCTFFLPLCQVQSQERDWSWKALEWHHDNDTITESVSFTLDWFMKYLI